MVYDKGRDKENVRNVSQSFRVAETFPTVKTRGVRTVYHVQQHFWIRGIEEDIVRVWKAVEPQPRFEHAFHVFSKSMRIPRGRNNVVILDDKAPLQIALLRQDVGPEAKIIIASDHPETFLAEAAPYVDDIWPLATLAQMAAFKFQKLLEQLKYEKDAWLTDTYLEQTINTLPDMIWFKDLQGLHLHVNDAFCTAVNKQKSDVEGRDHYYIWDIPREVYERSDYVCVETEDDVIKARKTCLFDEEVMSAQGLRKLKTYKTPIFDEDGKSIIGTVGIARDVTQMSEYKDTINRLTREDTLTGLMNREYFHVYAAKECQNKALTFVSLDLERFKELNERYGHELGDAVLKITAEELQAVFPDDVSVRMGGDEFGILIADGRPMDEVCAMVRRFQIQLREMLRMDERMKRISANVGIAHSVGDGTVDDLLIKSSIALDEAEKHGGGKYTIYRGRI